MLKIVVLTNATSYKKLVYYEISVAQCCLIQEVLLYFSHKLKGQLLVGRASFPSTNLYLIYLSLVVFTVCCLHVSRSVN